MSEPDPNGIRWAWEQQRVPRWFPRALLYVLAAVAAFFAARTVVTQVSDLLVILLVSLFLSFAIEPAVDFLADRGWRRGAATALVFVAVTGYGLEGPDATRPGFDFSAFWTRSGIMSLVGHPGAPPVLSRIAQGDHTTGINAVAATLAALRLRSASTDCIHSKAQA